MVVRTWLEPEPALLPSMTILPVDIVKQVALITVSVDVPILMLVALPQLFKPDAPVTAEQLVAERPVYNDESMNERK